jgi:hypothetical protein
MSDLKALFNGAVQATGGKPDAAAVQRMFIVDGGATPAEAIRAYKQFMRESGLSLTREQRKEKQNAILVGADLTTEAGVDAAIERLTKELDLATATATERVREFAKVNHIELPASVRTVIAPKEVLVSFLRTNRDKERKELIDGLVKLGYADGTAKSLIAMVPYMEEWSKQEAA